MPPSTHWYHQGPTMIVSGELDICGAVALEAELTLAESARPALIVLDLRELSFLDLHGLDAILAAQERAVAQGRRFACILGPVGPARRLFELAGVMSEVEVLDELPENRGADDQASASGAA